MLIGLSSPHLQVEALKAALKETKAGEDIQEYAAAVSALKEVDPQDEDAVLDVEWVDKTKKKTLLETSKLEGELKGYKNNLIKESIRVGMPLVSISTTQTGH